MLTVLALLAQLTLWKTNHKKSSALISWFSGTSYTGTQLNRSDKMLIQLQTAGVVSQLVEAYDGREHISTNNACLDRAG
jgi:hypothetical protein